MQKSLENSPPSTYILDVAIEMHSKFTFDNLPHAGSEDKNFYKPYIGRGELHDKFVQMLEAGKGVFLVTGYRGMGKTSFVNRTLKMFNNAHYKKDKLNEIKITIAQKQPREIDILILMVAGVREKCQEFYGLEKKSKIKSLLGTFLKISSISFLGLFLFFVYYIKDAKDILHTSRQGGELSIISVLLLKILLSFFVLLLIVLVICVLAYDWLELPVAWSRIDELFKRCYASTSFEQNDAQEISLESLSTKIGFSGKRKTEVYQIASSKEIEKELSQIIELIEDMKFVFVFDELDKVDIPGEGQMVDHNLASTSSHSNDSAYYDELRARKRAIQQIIAGLKNFLTTTKSVFVFIAGREMYEASLADVADRQSSIGSIFSYVFYIESLLKEDIPGTSSLSAGIEQYLLDLINPETDTWLADNGERDLYKPHFDNYNDALKKSDAALKINILLQNFVIYLTYRSNGSPKKLIKLIHEFIRVKQLDFDDKRILIRHQSSPEATITEKKNYLYFDYRQQQRIGFISYLYRPFLVKYGNSFKQYSDNLVVSTSYLFDHIFKFHPFAFSRSHLELMPEVLSANKTPALRDHIKKIIDYLSINHIKETEVGLFEYKFYSKTVNEIVFLSKTFEEESAAFNFTLDESFVIKHQVRAKLKELRDAYGKLTDGGNSNRIISSINFLNGMLGDLHFFDQEYDDAIIAYSDAIEAIPHGDFNKLDLQSFLLLQKFKLKLGLTYEKINSFEESLALYSGAVADSKAFVRETLNGSLAKHHKASNVHTRLEGPKSFFPTSVNSALSDVLQVVNQAFLSEMVLQEKMGVEGITAIKSGITIGGFLQLAEGIGKIVGRNDTIISNFYLAIGNLLYLKNSVKGFEWMNWKGPRFIPQPYFDDLNKAFNEQNLKPYKTALASNHRIPLMAIQTYILGLKYVLEGRVKDGSFQEKLVGLNLEKIVNILKPEAIRPFQNSLSKIHYKYIAIYFSHIGDCMLSMLKHLKTKSDGFQIADVLDVTQLEKLATGMKAYEISKVFRERQREFVTDSQWIRLQYEKLSIDHKDETVPDISQMIDVVKDALYENKSDNFERLWALRRELEEMISFHSIVSFYYLSGYYFNLCSRPRSHSFQLRKILYLVRLVISENQENAEHSQYLVTTLEKSIVRRILDLASQTSEFSDIHDFHKFKDKLADKHSVQELKGSAVEEAEAVKENLTGRNDIEKEEFGEKLVKNWKIRNSLSNAPDTREAIILLAHIKLRLLGEENETLVNGIIMPGYPVATQYQRLLELTYAAKLYEKNLEVSNQYDELTSFEHSVAYLHALISIIQIMEVYDNDYVVGNSFLAYHHYRLAEYFTFETGRGINKFGIKRVQAENIKNTVLDKYSIEKKSYTLFDKDYNYELAALLYDKANKLHSAGDDYKKSIHDIVYLEDDLNDAAYHFGAAMDRYLLINGKLEDLREKCLRVRNLKSSGHYEEINIKNLKAL
ncbi:hypothetical protein [Dyadobacter beijingensis]|nr:hypothetical protein [Dyadobacter beijingensis]